MSIILVRCTRSRFRRVHVPGQITRIGLTFLGPFIFFSRIGIAISIAGILIPYLDRVVKLSGRPLYRYCLHHRLKARTVWTCQSIGQFIIKTVRIEVFFHWAFNNKVHCLTRSNWCSASRIFNPAFTIATTVAEVLRSSRHGDHDICESIIRWVWIGDLNSRRVDRIKLLLARRCGGDPVWNLHHSGGVIYFNCAIGTPLFNFPASNDFKVGSDTAVRDFCVEWAWSTDTLFGSVLCSNNVLLTTTQYSSVDVG